ncbi:glycosyltransferase [Pseudonocardia nematodicida]|uniref:Glycosyltransferase n=1 Tax=Pseudonocardia nematodicida TaxID=1206997 RepID=A0ABV1KDN5_9PSEU
MSAEPPAPAVSVCIPVYQGAEYLDRTIRSILDQDADLEVVVRDNGSTDGSSEVVEKFDDPRVRLVRVENTVPMAANWAATVDLARGELVKIVCADDLIAPGSLSRQVQTLSADPSLAIAAGRTDMIDGAGRILFPNRHLPKSLLGTRSALDVLRTVVRHGGNPIGPSAALTFRRADYHAVGGLDGGLLFTMDLDLWVRLLRHGGMHGDARSAASFRIHGGSASAAASRDEFGMQREFTKRLIEDIEPGIRRRDRVIGMAGSYAALVKRYGLFVLGTVREQMDTRRA